MSEGRSGRARRQRREEWAGMRWEDAPQQEDTAYAQAAPQEEPSGEQPSWQQEEIWDDTPYEPVFDEEEHYVPEQRRAEILATNRAIRLSCTLASMISLFAVFLCFAERESRAIRHFSVQSAALLACHAVIGAVLLIVSSLFGAVPLLGFVVSLTCWLLYLSAVVTMLVVRVRMMLMAWNGLRFTLPVIGRWLEVRFC